LKSPTKVKSLEKFNIEETKPEVKEKPKEDTPPVEKVEVKEKKKEEKKVKDPSKKFDWKKVIFPATAILTLVGIGLFYYFGI